MWFHFSVSRVLEDGKFDAFITVSDDPNITEKDNPLLRNRGNGLYDYPDGMSIWSGYIKANNENDALTKIEQW